MKGLITLLKKNLGGLVVKMLILMENQVNAAGNKNQNCLPMQSSPQEGPCLYSADVVTWICAMVALRLHYLNALNIGFPSKPVWSFQSVICPH